jgi:C4-type Zn-finger protein
MTIDFESEQLMFCLKRYYGESKDGREFTLIVRNDESSTWVEDVEYDDEFTEEELEEIKSKFYEGI